MNRRGAPDPNNHLANAMTRKERNLRQMPNEGSVSMAELDRIRNTVTSTNNTGRQMSATDLILAVSRLRPEDRTPETVQNHISSYFLSKGETSMNKW